MQACSYNEKKLNLMQVCLNSYYSMSRLAVSPTYSVREMINIYTFHYYKQVNVHVCFCWLARKSLMPL